MNQSGAGGLLKNLHRIKWRVTSKGVLVGLAAGVLVVLYRLGIEFGTETAINLYQTIREQPLWLLPWAAGLCAAGYALYRLIRWEPYAKGSGIPQVEGIVLLGYKIRWYTVLVVRFLAGLISSFFGVSLGREGPSIQIGAAGAQAIAHCTTDDRLERNYLITAGASAGLSAAFNAPLSGIVFSLEEVHRSFSPNILIAATSAALTADVVSKYFFGLKPVLSYGAVQQLPIRYYPLLLVLGVVAGLVGAVTNKCLLGVGKYYARLPEKIRPAVALLLALPCGLFLPQVIGGGQNLVALSEGAKAGILFMLLLMAVKLAFTATSFGSGLPGGIFMPILSIGALTGGVFGQALTLAGVSTAYIPAFCVCAMAGAMASCVKAPVTSILLMAEMTGSLVHLLPVAAVAFIALLTSDVLGVSPIYEVLLHRMSGEQTENTPRSVKKNVLIEMAVEMGSPVANAQVRAIPWPQGALIVAIRRGETEFVPNGDTQILTGDYLVALSSKQRFADMNRELMQLCRTP